MWRLIPGGTWVMRILVMLLILAQVQASPSATAAPPRKKKSEPVVIKVEETVGDLAAVLSGGEVKVEGVGLVAGLENTGADPPPSWFRTQLVDEMSKAGVEHASKLLTNPQFSMVIVRMVIPSGASPTDRLDVEVEVPPACGTTSLAGGYLMATRLHEVMIAGGAPRTGTDLAIAQGPVMIGNAKDPKDAKVGRVLGGGKVKKESPFNLVIKDKRKSIRTAAILEKVINERFYQSEGSKQKGAATAKTDAYLTLRVPPMYHQNQERYFRVVQLLPMVDTPALRVQRLASWGKELSDVSTAGLAALKLEGLGKSAIEVLKPGLESQHPQVRFMAAEAMAYLDDPAGVDVLGETAIKLPKFRAYALAALAAMDQPASHIKLRKLMDESDIEVRYGAFNALRTLDPTDPMLGRVRVLEDPRGNDEESSEGPDSMALALATSRPRPEDPFALYIVDSEGPPIVHVSRSRRSEIVVFGRAQKLLPPVVLGTGAILLNAADKDEHVEISKIVPSKFGDSDMKIRSSMELGEVIRRIANLGATYPELVSILEGASRQKNLPGTLVVDAVPNSNVDYLAAILGQDTTKKAVDTAAKPAAAPAKPSSRLRRFFGRGEREAADETAVAKTGPAPATGSTASKDTKAPAEPAGAGSPAVASTTAAGASTAPEQAAAAGPKKDESLQRAGGEQPSTPRPRLLNRLFGKGQ